LAAEITHNVTRRRATDRSVDGKTTNSAAEIAAEIILNCSRSIIRSKSMIEINDCRHGQR
jgi:hypothetical protein